MFSVNSLLMFYEFVFFANCFDRNRCTVQTESDVFRQWCIGRGGSTSLVKILSLVLVLVIYIREPAGVVISESLVKIQTIHLCLNGEYQTEVVLLELKFTTILV